MKDVFVITFTNITELENLYNDNINQQKQILESARMASMGEMIGNIAHQWRQPLSAITAASSGMQIKKEIGMITTEEENIMHNIIDKNAQYLSETIDTFRNYIKEIKEVQSRGPYYFCGYSSGGIMAYEMARQLLADDEQIAFLSMIDSYPSEQIPSCKKFLNICYLWGFLKNIPYWIQDVTRRPPRKIIGDFRRKLTVGAKKIISLIHTNDNTTSAVDLGDIMDGNVEQLSDQRQYAMRVHYQALLRYQPKPYSGRIVMFRSRRQPLLGYHDKKLGWGKLVKDHMEVCHINGPHYQIMAPPYVERLAELFKERLRKAQQRNKG